VNVKTVATFALLAFVLASVVFLVAKESKRSPAVSASSSGPAVPTRDAGSGMGDASAGHPPAQGQKVIAYYFHGNFRCVSCVKIEALSRKAVTEGFPEDIKSGRLEFREVNVDEPQNRHFTEEYRLSSQSLVIVQLRDGRQVRWQNLEKVWTLLDSEREFISYVRDGVSGFLGSA
jgi:hypothetical protein